MLIRAKVRSPAALACLRTASLAPGVDGALSALIDTPGSGRAIRDGPNWPKHRGDAQCAS